MACEHDSIELCAYLDGELEPDRMARIARHVATCPECDAACVALASVDEALRELPRTQPSPQFEARFWARLARAEDDVPPWPARLRSVLALLRPAALGPALGLAAGASVAVAVAVLWSASPRGVAIPEEDWGLLADAASFELVTTDDYELMLALDELESWDAEERG